MAEFLVACAAFLIAHAVPSVRPLRAGLIARLGRPGYLTLYSAVSLALLAWLIAAALAAPYVALWTPPAWSYRLALVAAPLGLALALAGLLRPNPLSIGFRSAGFDPARPGVVGLTRHPVLWGFALWAFGHLPANGDLVSAVLFGALGVFALAGMAPADRRARRQLGAAEWRRRASACPLVPFAAGWPRLAPADLLALAAGLGLAALLLAGGHAWLFGVDPLASV